MGHFLHFGAGPNQLPEPWQNLNAEHDIRKRLKFATGSASLVFSEHVIEHVPWLQGFGFLQECLRVLEPGGVLRLAFPDVRRFLDFGMASEEIKWNFLARRYCEAMGNDELRGEIIRQAEPDDKLRAAFLLLLIGWQHQTAWTLDTAAAVLLTIGFKSVVPCSYGSSRHTGLVGVDGHHKDVGEKIAVWETTILEAQR